MRGIVEQEKSGNALVIQKDTKELILRYRHHNGRNSFVVAQHRQDDAADGVRPAKIRLRCPEWS